MNHLNQIVVSAYKAVGFVVLCAILLGLTGYLSTNFFFLVNSSWISPSVLSPSDERVLQLSAQFAQQSSLREKLVADRLELVARRDDALRTAADRQRFEDHFHRALEAELRAKTRELAMLAPLEASYKSSKPRIESSNQQYQASARRRLLALAQAHLLENDAITAGQFQLTQIEHSNLSLTEREVLLGNQRVALDRQIKALRQVLDGHQREGEQPPRMLGTDSLRLEDEYSRALLERQKASEMAEALARGIQAADSALARYDMVLRGIRESPYMRAAERSVTVAGVPYENIDGATPGVPIYMCRLGFVFCRKVGEVVALIDGEVPVKHPLHNQVLRGQLVQISLQDKDAVEHSVLFARRPPFLL